MPPCSPLPCRLTALAVLLAALPAAGGGTGASGGPHPLEPARPPRQLPGDGRGSRLVECSTLIHADEARAAYGVSGAGLTAAVLDTGIYARHVDFGGRIVAQVNLTRENGADPANAADGNGHGTNVAGIVAANGVHVGIAPGAELAAVKVQADDGTGSMETVSAGLDWVLTNRDRYHITVVNLSLGDSRNYQTAPGDLSGIQQRMQLLAAQNVAVVAAAGNGYYSARGVQGMSAPAIYPECLSAGAVYALSAGGFTYGSGAVAYSTAPDRICPFSQRLHPSVNGTFFTTLVAPGAPVTSTGIVDDHSSSTEHGTSQAAPVVSGVVLLLQEYALRTSGRLPSIAQLKTWLRESATPVTDGDDEEDNVPHTGLSFPRVDALAALKRATPEGAAISGTVRWRGLGLAGVTVTAGGAAATTDGTGYYQLSGLAPGSYAVTPSRPGYTFTPPFQTAEVRTSVTGIDFTGATPTYAIRGTVRQGGAPVSGVTVEAGGVLANTDAGGAYRLTGLPAGTYAVTPSRPGYRFSPASRPVTLGPGASGVDFTADTPPPDAPAGLQAAALSSTEIRLNWADRSADETGFRVEARVGSGAYAEIPHLQLPARSTEVVLTNAQPSATYTFRVWAFNRHGESARSNEATVTMPPPPPPGPTRLRAAPVPGPAVLLTWKAPPGEDGGYQVESSIDGLHFAEVGTTRPHVTTVRVVRLSPHTLYFFRVRAVSGGAYTDYSNIARARTPAG